MAMGGEPRCPHCGGGLMGAGPMFTERKIPHPVKCPVCEGRGQVEADFYLQLGHSTNASERVSCKTCNGRGIV